MAQQDSRARDVLAGLPRRPALRERLDELGKFERLGIPRRRGDRYFFLRNDGSQEQSSLVAAPTLGEEPTLLVDPVGLGTGKNASIADFAVSEDGRHVAYGLSAAGSDWTTWRIHDVVAGRDLDDELEWLKFHRPSWRPDGSGFFYARYPAPEDEDDTAPTLNNRVYFHAVGTPQSSDELIFERADEPQWSLIPQVTRGGRYLLVSVRRNIEKKNTIWFRDLQSQTHTFAPLVSEFRAEMVLVGNDGPAFWFRTTDGAPRGRVIAIDARNPRSSAWRTIIPESDLVLLNASRTGDHLVTTYLDNVVPRVRIYDLEGRFSREVALPGLGTVSGFEGRRATDETFFTFSSILEPPRLFRCDVATGETEQISQTRVLADATRFMVDRLFYPAQDGVLIPIFVAHRRDLERDQSAPVLLYGYGGFGTVMTPSFNPAVLAWLEEGGVYAVAGIRGGGEYGTDWHEAGIKRHKQRSIDDFIAATEWLVARGFAAPGRIAIYGRSNGGMLVGACLTQRPELYGAAVADVGLFDMLRFHLFTIGHRWVGEYGSPEEPEDAANLLTYSPYHQVRPARYPPILLNAAAGDDRVVPAHSFKFAAALQAAQQGNAPILLRVRAEVGHGDGRPTSVRLEEAADRLAFLLDALGPSGAGD